MRAVFPGVPGAKAWNFFDMLRVRAEWFVSTKRYLEELRQAMYGRPHEAPLLRAEKADLREHFESIRWQCDAYGFPECTERARYIADRADNSTVGECLEYIRSFDHTLEAELSKIIFVCLSGTSAYLYGSEASFGPKVYEAFPSARISISESSKCIAFERYNAAVRHLIDAAEIGLRVLAWDRRIRPKMRGTEIPLEFAQWGDLIGLLEQEVLKVKKWKAKSASASAQQFYNPALIELRAFNDGWRTHVSHCRSYVYHADEAMALFGHVRRLLERLATLISENQRTPYVWRSTKVHARD